MKFGVFFLTTILLYSCTQKLEINPVSETFYQSSMRGLFLVNDTTIFSSGTKGIIGLSSDIFGLKKITKNDDWKSLDFRDIHAFSEKEVVIMSAGDGCEIYKSNDGQKSWNLVYENHNKGIFFDGMDFWDNKNGLAFSDPIDNQLFIIETNDGGNSWHNLKSYKLPKTLKGEAGFAASGTGIDCVGDSTVYIGTGGAEVSRIFISNDRGKNWRVVDTPMRSGEASGIYSLTFIDKLNGILVGGNYIDSANTKGNCAITSDGGLTWKLPKTPPIGYMSCVTHNDYGMALCTGRKGTDISYDQGINWEHISDESYYSCVLSNTSGWLTGREGKMAKLIFK